MRRREETVRATERINDIRLLDPLQHALANFRCQGCIVNIEASFQKTCNLMCKMNVRTVCAATQYLKIVSTRPTEASGSSTMFATEQRWCGVVTTNKEGRTSSSCERALIRDVLTEEHRP